jgi:hypothetical protein
MLPLVWAGGHLLARPSTVARAGKMVLLSHKDIILHAPANGALSRNKGFTPWKPFNTCLDWYRHPTMSARLLVMDAVQQLSIRSETESGHKVLLSRHWWQEAEAKAVAASGTFARVARNKSLVHI